jgi:hypothetical protein
VREDSGDAFPVRRQGELRETQTPHRFLSWYGVFALSGGRARVGSRRDSEPRAAGELFAHQVFQHHLVQRRVVAVGDKLFGGLLVERARLPHQPLERAPAVGQMR